MKLNRALITAAPILIPLGVAHAQSQPPAIQQLQNMQQQQLQMPQPNLRVGTNAPELYQGENEDIGPQRILRVGSNAKAPHRKYFEVSIDSQVFYTDNATFSGFSTTHVESWVFVNSAQAAFAPDPYDVGPGKFAPAVGFSSQWYNYSTGGIKSLDFNAQTAFANLRYLLGNWQFAVGANYTRLVNQGSYAEIYNEWLPNLTVQRVVPLNENMAFIVGDAVSYHFTHVPPPLPGMRDDLNDHFDNTLFLTFNWQATAHFAVQPFYRFQYSLYKHNAAATSTRNDYLNAAGITLLYSFNQYVSLRAFYSYTTKVTDDANTPTYDEMNGGLGATLDVRF